MGWTAVALIDSVTHLAREILFDAAGRIAVASTQAAKTFSEASVAFAAATVVSGKSRVTVAIDGLVRGGDVVTIDVLIGTSWIVYWTATGDGDFVLEVLPTVKSVAVNRSGANATVTAMWIASQD